MGNSGRWRAFLFFPMILMTRVLFSCLAFACLMAAPLRAADWLMWRFDAQRSAASDEALPDKLSLEWERAYSPREQVWDDPLNHDLMSYDVVFEPVVLGDKIFIGFNDADKLVALDLNSGAEL